MERYLGLDVHAKSCTLAVISESGRRLRDVVVETNGQALVEALRVIPGRKHLCIEEGTQSTWLYEILKPHVAELAVVGVGYSRGSKSDKADAYAWAEELWSGHLGPRVFKAPRTYTLLRELMRAHLVVSRDLVRAQARLKGVYRSRGVATPGRAVYRRADRASWLSQLPPPYRCRAERLYTQIDFLSEQKQEAESDLITELSHHRIASVLRTCPGLGPIRTARLLSIVVTPHRFRTRQQLWSYCGLGIIMRTSADWTRSPEGAWVRRPVAQTRGLSRQHNTILKDVFKGAATTIVLQGGDGPMATDYRRMLESGTRPNLAKLTLARKIAATALRMWKDEKEYSIERAREKSLSTHQP
jgi:transposase